MSIEGTMRTAMYTELREACMKDGFGLPHKATPHLEKFIRDNVDYLLDMQAEHPPHSKEPKI